MAKNSGAILIIGLAAAGVALLLLRKKVVPPPGVADGTIVSIGLA